MRVLSRQKNSKMCIICGMENDAGVKAPFYNMEDNSVASVFAFRDIHQSYPGRTHGGMIGSMLDELMGRTVWCTEYTEFAVTTSMSIKYRKPVPYDVELKGRGYITKNSNRFYVAKGQILDADNNILAESEATYLKLNPEQVVDKSVSLHEEMCYDLPCDRVEIDLPVL